MTYLILAISAGINAAASILLKHAGAAGPLISLSSLTNWYLWAAMCCFGLNIIGYGLILQRMPLAIGYPLYVGVTAAIVLLTSFLLLRETITPVQAVGLVFIFAGTFLVAR